MTLTTRRPTGKPSWPILLLAGREKAGKSWAAITASASPLVGRTLYIGIGEDDPDEYTLIPGADFEIVEHDGTYPGILTAIRDAVTEPHGDTPTLIIVDSMTRLWNLIGDNMQAIANQRARGRRNPNGDYTISADLWNVAAGQWQDVMDALRTHQGPVIVTARLDQVAVMENGAPTTQKEWKVQAHKSLVFDVSAIVEMRERGQFLLSGVKSARLQLDKPRELKTFTVDALWGDFGLNGEVGDHTHSTVHSDQSGAEPNVARDRIAAAVTAITNAATPDALDQLVKLAKTRGIDGVAPVKEAITTARERFGATPVTEQWEAKPVPE